MSPFGAIPTFSTSVSTPIFGTSKRTGSEMIGCDIGCVGGVGDGALFSGVEVGFDCVAVVGAVAPHPHSRHTSAATRQLCSHQFALFTGSETVRKGQQSLVRRSRIL